MHVLLNTSFNDQESLVESPLDAIITALKTNINYLVLEKYLISFKLMNKKFKKNLLKKLEKYREIRIKKIKLRH